MKLIPNPGLWIPRVFTESDGTRLESTSWEELAKIVATYRRRAKLPAGDPVAEIYAQVCRNTPQFCLDADAKKKTPEALSHVKKVLDSVHSAIHHWILTVMREHKQGNVNTVSTTVAHERAALCKGCPFQTTWGGSCAGCMRNVNDAARIIVGKLLKNRTTGGLLGCRALGEDPRVSVWIEQNPRKDAPSHCWRSE